MKICLIGTGYVGLVTGVCFADVGNKVIGVDKNVDKVRALQQGQIPIFEPNLEPLVARNVKEKRLHFTSSLAEGLADAEVCFICVDTPSDKDGKADLSSVFTVAEEIGQILSHRLFVVTKSTVPVGTTFQVQRIIQTKLTRRGQPTTLVQVASNPEFLKEGDAVNDFMKPYRVVVGADSDEVAALLHRLYLPFMQKQDRFVRMNIVSAELAKYACNGMLATRISFMNEMARISEKVGADISQIRTAMGYDPRIGPDFLYAGLGYGGSCFPKDVKALIQMGKEAGATLSLVSAVNQVNEDQREWFWKKLEHFFDGQLKDRVIAIWGGAFKARTDDIRFSPALYLVDRLLESHAVVHLFDPVAMSRIRSLYEDRIQYCDNVYDCVQGVDALVVATEWGEFRSPDFERIAKAMRSPVIFDGKNLYHDQMLRTKGFHYVGVGIP